jgi:thymidylate synthase (FAD)
MSDTDSKGPEMIKCLDHGFVRLVDVMGDDQAIVQAARVSIAGTGVRPVTEDRGLIRYLMRMKHTTPFEMVEFKFHCAMPIFVARQWIRHRTANVNEMSARYSELPEKFYVPEPAQIQYQSGANKQGREGQMDDAHLVPQLLRKEAEASFRNYREWLEGGMTRELARINLPLSAYTEWYWKIDLHNLLHFLTLRLDKHAQYEIRVFAEAMATFVKQRCPLAWEAFEDFRLNAVTFSSVELRHLSEALHGLVPSKNILLRTDDWPTKREREEFEAKMKALLG